MTFLLASFTGSFSSSFEVGSRIQTAVQIDVYSAPASGKLGYQHQAAFGTIVAGPVMAAGYTWWEIDYDVGVDGWSAFEAMKLKQ